MQPALGVVLLPTAYTTCFEYAVVQEYCKNGSVFDILRKAEAELIGSAGGQQQALHTVRVAFDGCVGMSLH